MSFDVSLEVSSFLRALHHFFWGGAVAASNAEQNADSEDTSAETFLELSRTPKYQALAAILLRTVSNCLERSLPFSTLLYLSLPFSTFSNSLELSITFSNFLNQTVKRNKNVINICKKQKNVAQLFKSNKK